MNVHPTTVPEDGVVACDCDNPIVLDEERGLRVVDFEVTDDGVRLPEDLAGHAVRIVEA